MQLAYHRTVMDKMEILPIFLAEPIFGFNWTFNAYKLSGHRGCLHNTTKGIMFLAVVSQQASKHKKSLP